MWVTLGSPSTAIWESSRDALCSRMEMGEIGVIVRPSLKSPSAHRQWPGAAQAPGWSPLAGAAFLPHRGKVG